MGNPLATVSRDAEHARAKLAETREAKASLVRSLHHARTSGATLRQLADAAGLSHQRVAQLLKTD